MNKLKSISKLLALALFLSAGLIACKSSKKMADVSKEEDTTEQQKPEPTTVDRETPEETDKGMSSAELAAQLGNYFNAIANSSGNTTAANRNINEAKSMFASPSTPVLIIIHEAVDGTKDYDQPTTILDYMNYLKDQGKNLNEIYKVKTNDRGKIVELELIRK